MVFERKGEQKHTSTVLWKMVTLGCPAAQPGAEMQPACERTGSAGKSGAVRDGRTAREILSLVACSKNIQRGLMSFSAREPGLARGLG